MSGHEFLLEALFALLLVLCIYGFAFLATWLDNRDVERIVGPRFSQLERQPRERAVKCRRCGRWTWDVDAICDAHEDTAA